MLQKKNGKNIRNMPSNAIAPICLLDTMVVAGLFAIKKKENIDQHKTEWNRAIISLSSKIGSKCLFRVPTPVCYELMCWCVEWRDIIIKKKSSIFHFSTYDIDNEILNSASKYSIESQIDFYDESCHKVKSLDPLVAAYSLKYGYYLLTENQKDFPDSHFNIIGVETLVLNQKKGSGRRFLYLLQPKVQY